MLSRADEISGELSGSEACAFPLRHGFAFLLESLFCHEIHRFLLAHVPRVDALIENGVGNRAQSHLQLLNLHFRSAISLFRHYLFAINRPTFNESAATKNRPD